MKRRLEGLKIFGGNSKQTNIQRLKPLSQPYLKSIKTLTYLCTDTSLLLQLNSQLTESFENFRQHLPSSEGLIIRPGAITRALKTKRKYRQIKASKIPVSKKKRRRDWRYHNRVGRKADSLREVNNIKN